MSAAAFLSVVPVDRLYADTAWLTSIVHTTEARYTISSLVWKFGPNTRIPDCRTVFIRPSADPGSTPTFPGGPARQLAAFDVA